MKRLKTILFLVLGGGLMCMSFADELPILTVPLRLNRTVMAEPVGKVPAPAKRTPFGYELVMDGQTTVSVPENGSAALTFHGLPFVVQNVNDSLLWIPHYRAEGVLRVGVCAANVQVFDTDGNGIFDDLTIPQAVAVDLHSDGIFHRRSNFDLCGRILEARSISPDGSSMQFSDATLPIARVGQHVPPLTLYTIDGRTLPLSSRRLEPFLLEFWATWCPVCIGEIPTLKRIHSDLGLDIVSINVDASASLPQAREVLSKSAPPWPQVMTGEGEATSAWQAFRSLSYAGGLPVYVLMDAQGIIRYAGTGGGTMLPEIKDALARLKMQSQ